MKCPHCGTKNLPEPTKPRSKPGMTQYVCKKCKVRYGVRPSKE
jgi:DNA-directed RNA polymerase subunit RPC12/RpoP